ncbi:hypothetical protein BDN72DRAFT_830781 [Pluteus cervinus]|uniref:Uncharacterized protein n=1 Tax=Pluteus cervinus TaxID=181527 RepID=A0ACD3BF64_9AGAR|nr:hypothetical protein BDN72DRAFT_830781 [Pluteus cervinus]
MVRTPPHERRPAYSRKSAHKPPFKSVLAPLRILSTPRRFGESTRQHGTTRRSISRARYPYSYAEAHHEGATSESPIWGRRPKYFDHRGGGRDTQAHAPDIFDEHDSDNDQVDLEETLFHWEEEDTLFSDLMNEHPESEDTQLDHLAETLQITFAGLSTTLKKEMASAFVPSVNTVKRDHKTLDEVVDRTYLSGLTKFNKTGKNTELNATKDYEELRLAYTQIQSERAELLKDLEDVYAARAQLWLDLESKLTTKADAMRKEFNALPDLVEDAIAAMEKQSKRLEMADSSAQVDKKIKGLLG